MTARLDTLAPGATVLAEEPAGAITDHGPGTFLAAGAGITPFIPILTKHDTEGRMQGCRLVFANKKAEDIILRETWDAMSGLNCIYVTDQAGDGLADGPVNAAMLDGLIDPDRPIYVCGPGGFVDAMRKAVLSLGVAKDRLVIEAGW